MFRLLATTLLIATAPGQAQRKPMPHRPVAARPTPVPAPVRELPVFSFLGQTTEAAGTAFALGRNQCVPTAAGKSMCDNNLAPIKIGNANVSILLMYFNDGKIYDVAGETGGYAFADLLAAFSAKYGPPDDNEVRKWQNKAGSVFDNPTAIWHFKGGDLSLSQMGSRRDDCGFSFHSSINSPQTPAPPVNF